MDVIGWRASTFSAGCSLSFLASLIGAYLFTHWAPMLVWHFNLVLVSVQILAFLKMQSIFGRLDNNAKSESAQYKELNKQEFMEEINLSTASSDEEFCT